MRRVVIVAVALVVTNGLLVASADRTVETMPTAAPKPANSAVGALFLDGTHYCTASVVHSDRGNEVVTAAHCIHDGQDGSYLTGVSFAPGFHDGVAPYGYWEVSDEQVLPGWSGSSDQDLDVGFAKVRRAGSDTTVESLTGANKLAVNSPAERPVRVTGYPDGIDTPAVCATTTKREDTFQLRVECPGFATGTSGGPWIQDPDPATELGTVVGVIGGYEYGGDTDDVSYSSYFDDDVAALYRKATAGP